MGFSVTYALGDHLVFLSHQDMKDFERSLERHGKISEDRLRGDYGRVKTINPREESHRPQSLPEGKVFYEIDVPRVTIPASHSGTPQSIVLPGRGKKVSQQSLHELLEVLSSQGRRYLEDMGIVGPYRIYELGRGSSLIYEKKFHRATFSCFDEQEYRARAYELSLE